MTLTNIPVVWVVRGGHLQESRGKLGLGITLGAGHDDILIFDNRNAATNNGQRDIPAPKRLCTRIVWVDRDRCVAKHGLWTRGRNRNMTIAILEWVLQVPHMPCDFFHLNFVVGQGGQRHRVPIHQPLAAIDEPVFKEFEEGMPHGCGAHWVHGEPRPCPIATGTKFTKLTEDDCLILVFPLLGQRDKLVAGHVRTPSTRLLKPLLNDRLRSDASMVSPRQPKCCCASHAVVSNENVLQRPIERMP